MQLYIYCFELNNDFNVKLKPTDDQDFQKLFEFEYLNRGLHNLTFPTCL